MEIYRGPVTHSRLHPVRHAFVYEIFMVLIDLEVRRRPPVRGTDGLHLAAGGSRVKQKLASTLWY